MIYFIQAGDNGLIKIGYSKSPDLRLAKLQTGNPNPLKILAVIEGDYRTEVELHKKFGKFWAANEWFFPVRALLDFIKLNKESSCFSVRKVTPINKSYPIQTSMNMSEITKKLLCRVTLQGVPIEVLRLMNDLITVDNQKAKLRDEIERVSAKEDVQIVFYKQDVNCPACNNTGFMMDELGIIICWFCEGTGTYPSERCKAIS